RCGRVHASMPATGPAARPENRCGQTRRGRIRADRRSAGPCACQRASRGSAAVRGIQDSSFLHPSRGAHPPAPAPGIQQVNHLSPSHPADLLFDTPPIELETGPDPRFSVIWMHGLGADGSDFEPIVAELGLPDTTAIRFIFPHAPYRAVTCNGGYVMRAWYDIVSLAPDSRQIDEAGLLESRTLVRQLIQREAARGVPSERVILAGFSQGGAVAYVSALTHPA